MKTEWWLKIEELFHEASSLPEAEAEAFLRAACGDDEAMFEELSSLLRADSHAATDIQNAIGGEAARIEEGSMEAWIGRRLGPWRITSVVGEGGMGVVFRGVRDDQSYDQVVAIKLLRRAVTSDDLARFRRERQILAMLEHPDIARLLDGGTTDDGAPYLVMEYVEGEPLDRYCNRRELAVIDRLRLFLSVCSAVQYAHRKLVVHRDLKPANILVTPAGTVKLLDFGIGKLLDAELPEGDAPATALVLTPAYASPEQVRREPVTTATDVYSLGVVLYELLSGQRPYRQSTTFALMKAVCDEEPLPPSAAPSAGSRLAIPRDLAPDLDSIVMLAMRKDPRDRYQSVEALAEDLSLLLQGRPVRARPATLGYRAAKFLRRHRLSVAASAAAVVVVIGFVVALALQSSALARERDRAARERDRARAVLGFVLRLFEAQNPEQARGRELTARDLLDRGGTRVDTEFGDDPEMRAELLFTIGKVRTSLGDFDQARPMLESALRIRRERLGDHPATADSIGELAHCLAEQGEGARATALYREALAMRRRVLPPDDPRIALAMNDLGAALAEQSLFDEAEAIEREALRMLRARPGNDETTSMLLTNLGFLHYQRSELAAAEACFREALEIQRRILGSDHPLVLTSLNNLANTLNQQGRFAESEMLFREALAIGTRVFGQDHPDVARYHKNLGAVLFEQGRIEEAVASFRLSYALRLKALGDSHPDVARSAYSLASALVETDPVEAETLARGALSGARELPASVEGDLNLAIARSSLRLGVLEQAVERARRGVELRTASYPPGHWAVADAESVLGEALVRSGRRAEGGSLLRASYETLRTSLGDGRRVTRLARERLEILEPSPAR